MYVLFLWCRNLVIDSNVAQNIKLSCAEHFTLIQASLLDDKKV